MMYASMAFVLFGCLVLLKAFTNPRLRELRVVDAIQLVASGCLSVSGSCCFRVSPRTTEPVGRYLQGRRKTSFGSSSAARRNMSSAWSVWPASRWARASSIAETHDGSSANARLASSIASLSRPSPLSNELRKNDALDRCVV